MSERQYFKRHPDDQIIDDIQIHVVPRFKTSGLSGDEWRVSAVVELKRKGTLVYSRSYSNVDDAARHLPWLLRVWCEMPDEEIPNWTEQNNRDRTLCHQSGCGKEWTVLYKLKREASERGEWIDPSDCTLTSVRGFCDEHKHRGDCGREDAEDNYEVVR